MRLTYKLPSGLIYYPYLIELIKDNHCLIAGTTGAGKSVLENAIIYSLLCTHYPGDVASGEGCRFVLIDPKQVELDIYKNLPHTMLYADNMPDILQAVNNIRLLINKRLATMKKQGIRKSKESPIYVFIDELVDIVTSPKSKEIIKIIVDCISISRATNIFFIFLTQAPNRKILKPEIVLNCGCRVALRCENAIESRQILGDSSAVYLPKHGLAIVQQNIDRYNIKIPFYNDHELEQIVNHWTQQHSFINFFLHR